MTDPSQSQLEAYEALVRIQAGDWDDYVYRLYAALLPRLRLRLGALPTQRGLIDGNADD